MDFLTSNIMMSIWGALGTAIAVFIGSKIKNKKVKKLISEVLVKVGTELKSKDYNGNFNLVDNPTIDRVINDKKKLLLGKRSKR